MFSDEASPPRKHVSIILCEVLQKYPLQLDCTYHCGISFLGMFHQGFSYPGYVRFPFFSISSNQLCLDSITRTSTNLKHVAQAKQFSGLDITQVHIQNDFLGSRVISTSRAKSPRVGTLKTPAPTMPYSSTTRYRY